MEVDSTVQDMASRLAARANADSTFASVLLADPNAAAVSEFGRLPANMVVRATKAADGHIDVTIDGTTEGAEMTAEELEGVVGGDGFPFPISLP